jgi:lipoyl(octanoyl) transferase
MSVSSINNQIILRQWRHSVLYQSCWHAMREFTRARQESNLDELWLLEHDPVYTLGIRGQQEDAPADASNIPVVKSDRGGLITYHGPGQLIVYTLIDIRRRKLGLKALVETLEQSVINMLVTHEIEAQRKVDAPGVYVDGRKLASLGLRMINGRTYHGLSLNVDMDMTPFERINPCGYEDLEMTDLARLGWSEDVSSIGRLLAGEISRLLGYTRVLDKEATWKSST